MVIVKLNASIANVDALPNRKFLVTLHGVEKEELLVAVGEALRQEPEPEKPEPKKMVVGEWIPDDFKTK